MRSLLRKGIPSLKGGGSLKKVVGTTLQSKKHQAVALKKYIIEKVWQKVAQGPSWTQEVNNGLQLLMANLRPAGFGVSAPPSKGVAQIGRTPSGQQGSMR